MNYFYLIIMLNSYSIVLNLQERNKKFNYKTVRYLAKKVKHWWL